ncbi:hypothetical protein NDU88_001490 [Pleurodeles waltl]|uniref:Uncharacterized protein n=1 Tax=Pleurodeles waltl TaxID=8319 RepID=A0AAV7Q4H1_PLEWA|nr:hypothetical protein NDU88_001490 [Pleurodeles waltl]
MDPAEQVRGQRPWVALGAQQGAVARSLGSLQPARASEEERETSTGKAAEPRAAVPGWCKAGIRVKECEVGPSGPGCQQDLVYAPDAGVRHTVNVALDKATQTIKHLLLGFTDQQGWVPHCSSQEELPFSQDPSGSSSVANPHQADLNKL